MVKGEWLWVIGYREGFKSLRGRVNGEWFLLLCATQASIAGAMGYRLLVIGYGLLVIGGGEKKGGRW